MSALTRGRLLIVSGSLVVLIAAATSAWALLGEDEHSVRGTCDQASYELTLEPEANAQEVSFELQSMAPGEIWSLEVELGGEVLADVERTTDEDGEIDLDLLAPASNGSDLVVVASTDDGRTCTARLPG